MRGDFKTTKTSKGNGPFSRKVPLRKREKAVLCMGKKTQKREGLRSRPRKRRGGLAKPTLLIRPI